MPWVPTPVQEHNDNHYGLQSRFPKKYGSSSYYYGNLGGDGFGIPEPERRSLPEDYSLYQYQELPVDYFSQYSGQAYEENPYVESQRFPSNMKSIFLNFQNQSLVVKRVILKIFAPLTSRR